MAKTTINATCETVSSNKNGSQARFTVNEKPIEGAGIQPGSRTADAIINCSWKDPKKALQFEIGKEYPISIGS